MPLQGIIFIVHLVNYFFFEKVYHKPITNGIDIGGLFGHAYPIYFQLPL